MPFDQATYDYEDAVLKLLLKTDQILATEGDWLRRQLGENIGPNCIMGALGRASCGLADATLVYNADLAATEFFLRDIMRRDHAGFIYLSVFNDDPRTTFQDIKALLQRAIAARKAGLLAEARVAS